ncbi:MAG: LysM peptidoglycan-binding domain-containing protein [Anaerolineales bacterium]|nr:LysM peptidoglycan-binding domain-containing protein [Anaerolineales bacterium]
MNRFIAWICLVVVGLMLLGCDIDRDEQAAGDIDQFAPPAAAGAAAAAQTETIIRFNPATTQLSVGATQTIEIVIDNVTNMTGAEIQVQFNPAVLQVVDADLDREGVQIQPGDFPQPDFVALNEASNTEGTLQYAVVQLGSQAQGGDFSNIRSLEEAIRQLATQAVSGSGVLARVTFRAIANGTGNLNFTRTLLADSQAQPIPATSQTGQIIVGQGEPEFTPTPTSTLIPGEPTATFTPILPPDTPTLTPIPPTATPLPTFTPLPTPIPTNTPPGPQVYIPPGATQGFCYRVQPGESLANLGNKCAVDTRFCNLPDPGFISLANDLHPPGYIYPQQVLFIPRAYGSGPNVYVVQAGDTLAGIAEQCQMKVDLLAYVNGLAEDANLEGIGTLIIPRPPFAPPSRYPYPQVGPPSVWPPPCPGSCGY